MAALPEANEAAPLAAEAPDQEPPLALSDLGKKLREHQVPRDVCTALDTDGWTISSFRSVATSLEKFDEVLPELLPDCVLVCYRSLSCVQHGALFRGPMRQRLPHPASP